jgi:hypothetical protein
MAYHHAHNPLRPFMHLIGIFQKQLIAITTARHM